MTPSRAPGDDRLFHRGPHALMRPYALTGGRTESAVKLALETLVATTDRGLQHQHSVSTEQRQILSLCREAISVVEIAARICVPLGVARVLVGDLLVETFVEVHQPSSHPTSGSEYRSLLEKVLDGINDL